MILGIDPGARRIGVAVADLETRFARPVEVIDAKKTDPIARIVELIHELQVERVVMGRPLSLSGEAGAAVERQGEFLAELRSACSVEVVEYDERLTTVMADNALRASGRSAKDSKDVRDAVAAQILLQSYLDSGRP
jgi:putative holliday junction resolvase